MAGQLPSTLRRRIEWLVRRAEGAFLPDALLADLGAHLDPDAARLALRMAPDDVAVVGATERVAALLVAIERPSERGPYISTYGVCGVQSFQARSATIHRLPVEAFPRHVTNVYAVVEGGRSLLFDAGSGSASSERDLELGFAILEQVLGVGARRESIDTCVVSHAHVDHWAGLPALRKHSRARVVAHRHAAAVIERFEERRAQGLRDLDAFWQRAGLSSSEVAALGAVYASSRGDVSSATVDHVVADGDVLDGHAVIHAPGHGPGLVCLRVHDVVLTSDLVLAGRVPHTFPGPNAGVARYLTSLAELGRQTGVRLALGGHEEPIADLGGRIDEITGVMHLRLDRAVEACATPMTANEIATALFGDVTDAARITALGVAAAYADYLEAHGRLAQETAADGVSRYRPRAGR